MSVKDLTHADASIVWGVYTPKIFDGHTFVKYLGVYTPKIFDGHTLVKYLVGLHPLNI